MGPDFPPKTNETPKLIDASPEKDLDQGDLALFRSVLDAAFAALRSATLINGGAAVAIMAFAGSQAKNGISAGSLQGALISFVSGVFLSALACGGMYYAQRKYYFNYFHRINKSTNTWATLTIIFIILSYAAFIVGCIFGVISIGDIVSSSRCR